MWSIILREISEIGATRCQILRLKCAYSAPPDPLAIFEEKGEGKGRKGKKLSRRGRKTD